MVKLRFDATNEKSTKKTAQKLSFCLVSQHAFCPFSAFLILLCSRKSFENWIFGALCHLICFSTKIFELENGNVMNSQPTWLIRMIETKLNCQRRKLQFFYPNQFDYIERFPFFCSFIWTIWNRNGASTLSSRTEVRQTAKRCKICHWSHPYQIYFFGSK